MSTRQLLTAGTIVALSAAAALAQRAPPPVARLRWPPPIFVCVAPAAAEIDPATVAEMRQTLPRAAQVWSRETNADIRVVFADAAGVCRNGTGTPLDRLRFVDGQRHVARAELIAGLGGMAAAEALGNDLAIEGRLRFPTDYPANDGVCGDNGSAGPARCRFGDAVHEFGHLLGFRHDHVSAVAPSCTDLARSGERTDAAMSYYDARSVMNYCNADRWRGVLSAADVCSVRVAYPPAANRRPAEGECARLAGQSGGTGDGR